MSDAARLEAASRRAAESGEAVRLAVRVTRADGAARDLIVGLTPQRDDSSGRLIGYVVALTDITEQLSAEPRGR